MTQPILDCPRIVSGIRQRVAAGVAQHVSVNPKLKAGALTDALYKPIDSVRGKRSAAFGRETQSPSPETAGVARAMPGFRRRAADARTACHS